MVGKKSFIHVNIEGVVDGFCIFVLYYTIIQVRVIFSRILIECHTERIGNDTAKHTREMFSLHHVQQVVCDVALPLGLLSHAE